MSKALFWKTSLWMSFLLLVLFAPTALAQSEPTGLSLSVAGGFDGLYKGEYWLPVIVTVANSGAPIEGEVRVFPGTDANANFFYRAPLSLPTQSNKRVTLTIQLPNAVSSVLVQLVDANGRVIASTRTNPLTRVLTDNLLYGVVSPDPGEFAFLENVTGSQPDADVAFLALADLPDVAVAWNALDVLVLNDTDTSQLTANQLQALEAWVSTGGQLVVTGGANWQKTAVPLQEWLPVTLTGSETVADLPELAEAAGFPFRDPGPYVVTTSNLARGDLLFHEAGLPLLARTTHGRGSVYFLALDPRFAPLLDWDGAEAMFAEAANRVPLKTLWGSAPYEGYAAQSAVTRLPELDLPSVWELAGFLLLYVTIVGPVNYFILKRRNQLERAWVTLPVLIVGFTAVTYFTGFQLRGNAAIINQLSVAYSQADSPQARIHSLVGLYSPRRSTYDLLFPADSLARPFSDLSGFGTDPNAEAITYSNHTSIDGVRVDVSDVETFTAQSDRPAIDVSGQGALNQQGGFLRIEATVQNNSDVTLEDSAILFGNTAVSIGNLEPGQTASINEIVGSTTAYALPPLTGQASVLLGYDYYSDAKLYSRYEFLQALEGENYGGTPIKLSRSSAVLIGWTEEAQLEIDLREGNATHTNSTLYFIEIPLSQNLTDASNLAGEISLPLFLLDWTLLPDSTAVNASPDFVQLNGGEAHFEYQPDAAFQDGSVVELAIQLEKDVYSQFPVPELSLWNWQTESWDVVENPVWGETAVPNPAPYIGPDNTVRIKLSEPGTTSYNTMTAVYPLLTVDMDN